MQSPTVNAPLDSAAISLDAGVAPIANSVPRRRFSGGFGPFPEQVRASCAVPVHNLDAWEAGQRRAIPLRGAESPYPIEPNSSTGIF